MKKIKLALLVAVLFSLTACSPADSADSGASSDAPPSSEPAAQSAEPTSEVIDLSGEWRQVGAEGESDWMAASVSNGVISVDWVFDNGDTTAIYWVGSFDVPKNPVAPFTITSVVDHDAVDYAMLAAQVEEKDFTYADGQISFQMSAMGMTTKIRMERVEI